MLQTHEMRLESLNALTIVDIPNTGAHFVKKHSSYPASPFRGNRNVLRGRQNRGIGGRYSYGGGRRYNQSSGFNKPLCQICNKADHTALKYFYWFDLSYQNSSQNQKSSSDISEDNTGSIPVHNSQAHIASSNTLNDAAWLLDSGATNHETSDGNTM